jgi:type IV pilus assembly protein PilP
MVCSPSAPICKPLDVWDGLRQGTSEPYGFQKVCLFREFTGQKQDLENFPLESLQFRGTLAQDGVRVALVWAGDRLHQVRSGAYLGTRKGKVLEISPTAIVLRELEQDASGQWKPKNTVLPVREGDK